MKQFFALLFLMVSFTPAVAQEIDYNLKKGFVAAGYDVVAYFSNQALEGSKDLTTTYGEAKFKFVSQENLSLFISNPEKYIPEYGGYCAYAIADKGKKVGIDPETFEVRDGKLYLFYNSWGTNTLEKWLEEGPEQLRQQADAQWERVKYQ